MRAKGEMMDGRPSTSRRAGPREYAHFDNDEEKHKMMMTVEWERKRWLLFLSQSVGDIQRLFDAVALSENLN